MPAVAIDDDLVGRLLGGRFRLRGALGMGGMGAVYEAEDIVLGREVALKLLHSDGDDDSARLEREARAASRISARHVAAVYDVGQDPEFGLYLVMERLRGLTLEDRIATGTDMPLGEVAAIGVHIAMALEAAHKAGVVHRDLKPGNVFLLEDGGLKVMDFGIAKIVEGSDSDTATLTDIESIIGTPAYIAPEAVRKGAVGPPSDVYALGIMLFEMLSGERPFSDPNHVVMCAAHLNDPPPLLKNVAPGLPSSLSPLVDAMLRKKPGRRPALIEIRKELSPFVPTPGTGPYVATPVSAIGKRPWVIAAVGLGALVLAGVALMANTAETESAEYETTPLPPLQDDPPSTVMETESVMAPIPVGVEAPARVSVNIDVIPARAQLIWDGERVTSPFQVAQDDRAHRLEVSAAGFRRRVQTVHLEAGDNHLSIRLLPNRRAPMDMLADKIRPW